jgi:protease-4
MNRIDKCASQHFGPWMILERWMNDAVSAVNAGVYPTVEAAAVGDYDYEINKEGVATIPITGHIIKGESSFGGTSSVRVRQQLRSAIRDKRVKSILLDVDSPGGTVAGTAELAGDVRWANARKPVHSYIQDLGASAAYWVASQAERVTANATAEIGSIGTVAVVADSSEAYDKAGVKVHVITTGPYKAAGVDGTEITGDQLEHWTEIVNDLNEHFLRDVARGRKLDIRRVRGLADGRTWIGTKAADKGLIDGIEPMDAAIRRLRAARRAPVKTAETRRRRLWLTI